jgi:Na+/H+ antiporter NhaC
LAGIVVGAILVGKVNFLDGVLIPSVATTTAATILILYLWLLGGLMGIWAKTGASRAFADFMATHFVRGPRTAKLVAWMLGVVFFQGGTVSSVLVGTTVRPLADKERVSHEELSLIVDATSSPIAVLLAFNAWPIYVQGFIGVAGVSYLATESDRVAFFFKSIPFSFYAILSVLFTLLLSVNLLPLTPKKLLAARRRAWELGQLNAPGAEPLAAGDLADVAVPPGYTPRVLEFVLPLCTLLGIAVGTYYSHGSPKVLWAFGAALLLASLIAWFKGMGLREITLAITDGQKSVVLGSIILLLAITIGSLSQEVGAGRYLVTLLGGLQWYWILPAVVFLVALVIAFSTGTSWATFAVTLPLVMPLAHAIGQSHGLAHPELFVTICFAACLNGGVFGDQCSPISDTTILSAMCTGSDLMDHVTTQIPVAAWAAVLAIVGWTAVVLLAV